MCLRLAPLCTQGWVGRAQARRSPCPPRLRVWGGLLTSALLEAPLAVGPEEAEPSRVVGPSGVLGASDVVAMLLAQAGLRLRVRVDVSPIVGWAACRRPSAPSASLGVSGSGLC